MWDAWSLCGHLGPNRECLNGSMDPAETWWPKQCFGLSASLPSMDTASSRPRLILETWSSGVMTYVVSEHDLNLAYSQSLLDLYMSCSSTGQMGNSQPQVSFGYECGSRQVPRASNSKPMSTKDRFCSTCRNPKHPTTATSKLRNVSVMEMPTMGGKD